MSLIGQMDEAAVHAVLAGLMEKVEKAGSLQEAAQRMMEHLGGEFAESLVLARTYGTIPFGVLPARDRSYVEEGARSGGAAHRLRDETTVVSLLGTSGVEPGWCDRYGSRDHLAIPLPPEEFGAWRSMVTDLICRLGKSVAWCAGRRATAAVSGPARGSFAVFADDWFVADAATARDDDGRLLIPAQDFVRTWQVRSVVGVGGEFAATGMILACVLFSRESLAPTPWLSRVPLLLGTTTLSLVSAGKIYSAS